MKKHIIERYDRNENNEVVIKIAAKNIEDLYSYYDKESSFSKKDLDEELVDYIIDSAKEIGNEEFVLKFYLEKKLDDTLKEKIRGSVKNFFQYLQELELKQMDEEFKNAGILILIGFVFVAISIVIDRETNIIWEILSEGVMVAGWVSLWEAMATFLIKWFPKRKKHKLFNKISLAKVEFE